METELSHIARNSAENQDDVLACHFGVLFIKLHRVEFHRSYRERNQTSVLCISKLTMSWGLPKFKTSDFLLTVFYCIARLWGEQLGFAMQLKKIYKPAWLYFLF